MSATDAEPSAPLKQVVIPSDLRSAKETERAILREVRAGGFDEDHAFAIKLALEEALTNAIKHGNRLDKSKTVTVRYAISSRQAEIVVTDQGSGFSPDQVPDPTTDENIQRSSGRGILLMRASMARIDYTRAGNEVRMITVNEK